MAALRSVGMVLCLIATCGILYCVASRRWKVNSQVASQQVNRGVQSYEGLWVRCVSYIPGVFQCDRYDNSYLGLGAALNAQRGMMIVASIFGAAGLAAGCLGLGCISVVEGKQKAYSSRGGGVMFILASLLTLAAITWYAINVVRQFNTNNALNDAFAYQFGAALFIGWIASGLGLIGAAVMTFCSNADDDYRTQKGRSLPGRYDGPIGRSTEYV